MTEFEINKAVVKKLGLLHKFNDLDGTVSTEKYRSYYFDPCNNIEQAWDIMLKYNICVTREPDGDYTAFKNLVVGGYENVDWCSDDNHKKPLVAAMLCFLGD